MTDTITLPRAEAKEILKALRTFDAGAMIKAEQMLVTAMAQQAVICNSDLIGFLPSEEKRQQTVISQNELRAALAQQAEQAPTGFEKYLKEGETPLQRLEREIKDGSALMKIYGKALTQIQELQAQRWTTPIAFYEIANNEYGEIEYEFSVYPRPGFKPLFAQAIPAAPKGVV